MNKIVKVLSEWAWHPCWSCNWPVPDGAATCSNCGAGQAN